MQGAERAYPVVSPVTGGGISLPHIAQLFILALREGKTGADALANHVWEFLDSIGERLVRDGQRIDSKDENLKEFRGSAVKFLKFGQPLLEALQIIDPPEITGSPIEVDE